MGLLPDKKIELTVSLTFAIEVLRNYATRSVQVEALNPSYLSTTNYINSTRPLHTPPLYLAFLTPTVSLILQRTKASPGQSTTRKGQ